MIKKYSLLIAALLLIGCSANKTLPPRTVDSVDLNRYTGKWYEIAHLPFYWQNDCVNTTATYSIKENGEIRVINQCRHQEFFGKIREFEGKARVVDAKTNAKLEVQFFWPFWGDYWILDLADDYNYVLVGTPDKKYLWVLSRSQKMEKELLAKLVKKAASLGYDVKKLILTEQLQKP